MTLRCIATRQEVLRPMYHFRDLSVPAMLVFQVILGDNTNFVDQYIRIYSNAPPVFLFFL